MPIEPNPRYRALPDGRVELRSQVRFKMLPESAPLAREYRANGNAQVLSDTGVEYMIGFPSVDESLWVIEIVHHDDLWPPGRERLLALGQNRPPIYESHEGDVRTQYASFSESHPPAEIVAEQELEDAPPREKWIKVGSQGSTVD